MTFSVNHPILFVLVGIVIAVVLAQSIYFLVRAVKRAKEKGMDMSVIKKTITSSAIFTIAPAVSILVGVVVLSKSLGVALPWLRLSVIGSLTYETVAAANTLGALDLNAADIITDASTYVTVAFVMTLGIIIGLILVPLVAKRIQGGLKSLEKRDKRWMEIFNNAMFLGMISAFLGYVFSDVSRLWTAGSDGVVEVVQKVVENGETVEKIVEYSATSGLIPVLVMAVSAVVMILCGLLSKTLKQRWITDYALPISLVSGMAAAIPITGWLG